MTTVNALKVEKSSVSQDHPDLSLSASGGAGAQMSHESQDGKLFDDKPSTTEPCDQEGSAEEGDYKYPPDKVIDVKAFLDTFDNRPIFTRKLLQNAAEQLREAAPGLNVEMVDYYGNKRVVSFKEGVEAGKEPEINYNNYHVLADDDPYRTFRLLKRKIRRKFMPRFGPGLEEMIDFSHLPVHIDLRKDNVCANEDDRANEDDVFDGEGSRDYYNEIWRLHMTHGQELWYKSIEPELLESSLRKLSEIAQVTNIVCLSLGSLPYGEFSTIQHIVASDMAQELAAMYKRTGRPLERPITIIAQDLCYTPADEAQRAALPISIHVVWDLEGFLAINSGTLVMSCYPSVPVKQIVAHLAMDSTDGIGLAAMLWNDSNGDDLGDVDTVT